VSPTITATDAPKGYRNLSTGACHPSVSMRRPASKGCRSTPPQPRELFSFCLLARTVLLDGLHGPRGQLHAAATLRRLVGVPKAGVRLRRPESVRLIRRIPRSRSISSHLSPIAHPASSPL
jgi:hypothetical protein